MCINLNSRQRRKDNGVYIMKIHPEIKNTKNERVVKFIYQISIISSTCNVYQVNTHPRWFLAFPLYLMHLTLKGGCL